MFPFFDLRILQSYSLLDPKGSSHSEDAMSDIYLLKLGSAALHSPWTPLG